MPPAKRVTKHAVNRSAPERIWLHSEHPEEPTSNGVYFFDLEWLETPDHEVRDVEYVRADLVRAALKAHGGKAWRRLSKALGVAPPTEGDQQ